MVILGEVHDNPDHHLFQAAALEALVPKAVVFEMLTPEQAAAAAGIARDDARALASLFDWEASGWPDFAIYAPVFAASAGAALFGGALPRETVRAAMSEGAAAVFGAEAERYGLAEPLSEAEQSDREAEQMRSHCDALPATMLPGMVEAQRLRDAALARAVVRALDAHGPPVAVITGNGHARHDRGIAVYLTRALPGVSVTTVGQIEEGTDTGGFPFDQWRITAAAPREDPCAAFR